MSDRRQELEQEIKQLQDRLFALWSELQKLDAIEDAKNRPRTHIGRPPGSGKAGRPPIGKKAMTSLERTRRHRAKKKLASTHPQGTHPQGDDPCN